MCSTDVCKYYSKHNFQQTGVTFTKKCCNHFKSPFQNVMHSGYYIQQGSSKWLVIKVVNNETSINKVTSFCTVFLSLRYFLFAYTKEVCLGIKQDSTHHFFRKMSCTKCYGQKSPLNCSQQKTQINNKI